MIAALMLSMAVKSSLIAAAGLALAAILKGRPADHADILRATVCLVLALPVAMVLVPGWTLALLPAAPVEVLTEASRDPLWQGEIGQLAGVSVSAAMPWPSAMQVAALLWVLGGLLVVARLVLGIMTLDRWTGEGQVVTAPAWRNALSRLAPKPAPRLVMTQRLPGPVSWGVRPGTILLDPASLSDPTSAEAILAHELAHLRRGDWLFLILSRLALAIFWFNPLVWALHATLIARTEEAADAAAVSRVDRQTYAHALVRLASQPVASNASIPWTSTAMAGDVRSLEKRIACLMTPHTIRSRPLAVAGAVLALSVIATPLAALQVTQDVPPPPPAPAAPVVPVAPPAPPVPPLPVMTVAPVAPPAPQDPPAPPVAPRTSTRVIQVTSYEDATPQERAEIDQARADAEQARIDAGQARRQAEAARIEAERARVEATRAREVAGVARQEAARQMASGAEEMRRGAEEMRREAHRLEDPAYRATQIVENRERGAIVTDAQLVELAATLRIRADTLDERADAMQQRARTAG